MVLLVDHEGVFLSGLREGLARLNRDTSFVVAEDGYTALEVLESQEVLVIVCDLAAPMMGRIELLTAVSQQARATPMIALTERGSPQELLMSPDTGHIFVEKTIEFQRLNHLIRSRVTRADEQLHGFPLLAFLEVVSHDRTTGVLDIASQGRSGRLWVSEGQAVDATAGDLDAEAAFEELLSWTDCSIRLSRSGNPPPRRLFAPSPLLLRAGDVRPAPVTLLAPTPVAGNGTKPVEAVPADPHAHQTHRADGTDQPVRGADMSSLDEKTNLSRALRRPDVRAWFAVHKDGTPPYSPDLNKAQIDRLKYFSHLATSVGAELGLERAAVSLLKSVRSQLLTLDQPRLTLVIELTGDADVEAVRAALKENP